MAIVSDPIAIVGVDSCFPAPFAEIPIMGLPSQNRTLEAFTDYSINLYRSII